MSKCAVTNTETNDKWNGFHVCREIREMAKEMIADPVFSNMTMRQRLIYLQKEFSKDAKKIIKENTDGKPE